MDDWLMWLAVAGVLVIVELLTGTFYILMMAIGLAVGGLAALAGMSLPVQIIIAAVVGLVATSILHRSRFGAPARKHAERDPDVNLDIGQTLAVDSWTDGRARVKYRGALWDVELGQGAQAQPGQFRVVEVAGNRLIVHNA